MSDWPFWLGAGGVAWVGHAAVFTAVLNRLYGLNLPKPILKNYRLATALMVFAFPPLAYAVGIPTSASSPGFWAWWGALWFVGGVWVPVISLARHLKPRPWALGAVSSEVVDLRPELGEAALGTRGPERGVWSVLARVPGNQLLEVEFTRLEVRLADLPPEWNGVEVLLLSDLHFHGTPARAYFDAVLGRLASEPPPDLVLLAGDYLDRKSHLAWIGPLLAPLRGTAGKFAVVGNHDGYVGADSVRAELRGAGYTVLSDAPATIELRGLPLTLVGHEGPWFPAPRTLPDSAGPVWVLAHSPDAFPMAARHGAQLTLAGHVHGGQVRLPFFGSIFVPSVYGRRFDCGVFVRGRSALVVGRGLSGKEPLRLNCRPQVLRLVLRRAQLGGDSP